MPVLRLKRRAAGGAAGAPAALATTEPAYNEVDDILYLGFGDAGSGVASSIRAVAGAGAFVGLTGIQTIAGAKTYSTTPVVGTLATADSSTSAASTAFVKNQAYLIANQAITVSGDVTGSGATAITATLAASGVTAGTYTKITVDAKGRATVGALIAAADVPTLTAAKISDFDTQVRLSRMEQLAVPLASVSMNSQKIINLATPTAAGDAANKGYVDAVAIGVDSKESVRLATTANIAVGTGTLLTIDGVVTVAGDRVLVKNQTAGAENGIYIAGTGAWARSADASTSAQVTAGMYAFVSEGTVSGDIGYILITNDAIVLGTTALLFTAFSGAGQIVAGAGLTLTGTTIDVVGTANRITANADSIDIAATYVGQSSITTVGTVTAGVWSATAIGAAAGGTGLATYAVGDLITAAGATTLARLAMGAAGAFLAVNAGGTALAYTTTFDGGTF